MSPRSCAECGGGELTNPRARYCSTRCKSAAGRRRPEVRAKDAAYRRRRYSFPCVACGAPVERSGGSRYSGVALCGDYGTEERRGSLCRTWYRTGEWPSSEVPWSHPIRSSPVPEDHPCRQAVCKREVCSAPFTRVWPGQLYCTRRCAAARTPHGARFFAGYCRNCGTGYIGDREAFANGTHRTCSLRCSEKYHRRLRRAARNGGQVEPYTLAEIAARDRERCGICRRRVPMNLAVPHPKAPTVDHVIPLSQGGNDVRSNVRLAHFLCNARRGNRGEAEQLAMI